MRRWQHGFGWLLAGQLLALLLVPLAASAHESRPAYLAVTETAPGQFSVLWRTPVLAGMRLPIVLKLPGRVKNLKDPVLSELADSLVERRWVDAGPNGLAGERIEFAGLQLTITDVLVRVQKLDGTHSTTLVHPSHPWVDIATSQGPLAVAGAYLSHGIEHILFGFDHLLFVLGLHPYREQHADVAVDGNGFHCRPFDHAFAGDDGCSPYTGAAGRGLHRTQHPSPGE